MSRCRKCFEEANWSAYETCARHTRSGWSIAGQLFLVIVLSQVIGQGLPWMMEYVAKREIRRAEEAKIIGPINQEESK